MKIKVHTSFVGKTGYNAHSRDFFTALSKLVKLKIRNFTAGDSWEGLCDDPHAGEIYLTDSEKSLLGEQTVINAEGEFYDVEIYDGMSDIEDYDIDIVLNETNHRYFYDFSKFKGKFKIAYNVWESTKQPQVFFDAILQFDQFWVPSEWQKQVTIDQGYPADRIFVVPEGVDVKKYYPDIDLDAYDDNRFKFLIFGRWDHRKSTKELIETFLKTFDESEPVDLIMSVDNPYSIDGMKSTQERLDRYDLNDDRIKYLSFVEKEDYIKYLKNGHVFLSCARSEGWNLPLIEALACGTPSIYSDWGAQLQFAGGKGFPVKVLGEMSVDDSKTYGLGKPSNIDDDSTVTKVDGLGDFGEPDFDDLSKVMRDVYTNYWEYKSKALLDSKLISEEFTWENAAKKAYDILDDIYQNKLKAEVKAEVEETVEIVDDENIKPKVSVVTSFYDIEKYVDGAIDSVLAQTYIDFEYIITDDFSTDGTKEQILKWVKKDKRIRYIEQTEKREIYWNPHKYANGDIVVIFDSNDTLVPRALEVIVDVFNKNPEVVLIDSNSHHYDEIIHFDNFKSTRFCEKPKYFQNYLTYYNYYINNSVNLGEIWGGLRSFRNILPKEYDFTEDFDLMLDKHEDLLRFLKFEEIGKVLYIGRVLNNVRDRKDSNSNTSDLEFGKIWNKVFSRRQNLKLYEPTISNKYDSIWESIYSMGYSDIHTIVDKKKISILNSEYSKEEEELVKEIYFDHNIVFDEIEHDVDYYFINFNTFEYINKTIHKILYTKHDSKISVSIQSKILESEPDLILDKEGNFNSKLNILLNTKVNFKWHIYANTYFFSTFNLEVNEISKRDEKEFVFFTGGDEGYLPIVETCVKSLNEHSNFKIVVYGFNCDVPFDYPNMEKRRLDISRDKKFEDRDTRPYYYKIDASLDCIKNDKTKVYIWLDGDCVVTDNISSITKYYQDVDRYPLCMRYKHEDLIHRKVTSNGYSEKRHGEELGDLFQIHNNNDFIVATGLYMFDFRSEWFFTEVLFHHNNFLSTINAINNVDDMTLAEERLFNVLFWKYKFKKHLPITWISNTYFTYEDGNNDFVPKIQDYIKRGFDIMFDYNGTNPLENNLEEQGKILFYHGQRNISKVEEMINSLTKDKLMIVAHPDDETIFGGGMLLNEDAWKVVLVTSGDGDGNDVKSRISEFKSNMNYLGVDYEILGFKDDMNNVLYDEYEVEHKLREIISSKNWSKIVTHNKDGEYNHIIHKSVHNIVKNINPDNLYFFKKSNIELDQTTFKQKNNLLSFYKSQNVNMPGFRDYLIYEGTTEIIEHQDIKYEEITHIPNVIFNFNNISAFVEIIDTIDEEYHVEFLDGDSNEKIYDILLKSNSWAGTSKMKTQLKWSIKIRNKNNIEVFNHDFYLDNKNLNFTFEDDVTYDKLIENLDIINLLIDKYGIEASVITKYKEVNVKYSKIRFTKTMINIQHYAEYNFNNDDNLNEIFGRWLK